MRDDRDDPASACGAVASGPATRSSPAPLRAWVAGGDLPGGGPATGFPLRPVTDVALSERAWCVIGSRQDKAEHWRNDCDGRESRARSTPDICDIALRSLSMEDIGFPVQKPLERARSAAGLAMRER